MVLYETIPTPNDIQSNLHGGDETLYRACATHLTNNISYLNPSQTTIQQVEQALATAMNHLKATKAEVPPHLSAATKLEIMRFLVNDVEKNLGSSYSKGKIESQPLVEAALVDIFTEEINEAIRGWRGITSTTSNFFTDKAMDHATQNAAAAFTSRTTCAETKGLSSFKVAIIGAGASGLCAAIKLKLAGIDYVVLERTNHIGGVWAVNNYPEAGCDIPSHYYSYSFAPNPNWSKHYSKASEIHAYFDSVAKHYNVSNKIQFQTKVIGAQFNDSTSMWHINYVDVDDNGTILSDSESPKTLIVNALITACGQLSEPNIPPIPGKDSFQGPSAHTAHWSKIQHNIKGKNVAVVGTGASAMQLMRTVAAEAKHVTIFQQLPGWFAPRDTYHKKVEQSMVWQMRHVPLFQTYYRFRLYWSGSDGLHEALFPGNLNENIRSICEYSIKKQVGDDLDLLEKVLPKYPPFCTRVLVDNEWIKTLKRDNVTLIPFQVDKILPNGIEANKQIYSDIDTIAYSTGFRAQDFLFPMTITGKKGLSLRDHWREEGGGTAFLGITVPKFPNFFMCYGPSTNLAHGGSIIFHSECQVRYIMNGIAEILNAGKGAALEVTQKAHDDYNAELAPVLSKTVFQADCGSRYKDANGNVTGNSPWRLVDYFQRTKKLDATNFQVSYAPVGDVRSKI